MLSVLILFLHKLALDFFIYWTTDWYDIIMHFLGGFVIALIAYLLVDRVVGLHPIKQNTLSHFSFVFGILLIVGLGWELFEIWTELIDPIADRLDSLMDLLMDSVGGITAFFYARNKFK